MAVNLYCPACRKTSKLGTKQCPCGHSLKNHSRFRVRFQMPNGKWKSRVVDTLDMAKTVEAKYRVDRVKEKDFGIHESPHIDKMWKKYIKWAEQNKRSWRDDKTRWETHVKQHVKNKRMDAIYT
jgi:hypothetical protein